MDIAFHGRQHHDGTFLGLFFLFQQGFDSGEGGLHGFGGAQQLGQEIFLAFVARADFGNGGDESFLHQGEGVCAPVQFLFHQTQGFGFLPLNDGFFEREGIAALLACGGGPPLSPLRFQSE